MIFLLKLLFLLFLLKLGFYFYNSPAGGPAIPELHNNSFNLLRWSFTADLLVLLVINTPFFILLALLSFFKKRRLATGLISTLFLLVNFICVLLNLADIFYFHFHLQRADADLLYVLQNPFQKTLLHNPVSTITALAAACMLFYTMLRLNKKLLAEYEKGRHFIFTSLLMLIGCLLFSISGRKKLVPTYPLVSLNSTELQFVENSFHSFLYSLYRQKDGIVRPFNFFPAGSNDDSFNINKSACNSENISKKNIVLFIMESIPEDFFNDSGKYKVSMPFLDSLLNRSTYFSNAYSYSHSSNKGIVAILAGIPTITEIPLYHSNYAAMPVTHLGTVLDSLGYSSSFFIGDDYDDFGFAKCCNWLGIQHYYCKKDVPGYKQLEMHTMGLHDKYVLNFMGNTINKMRSPFFAVNYNISTHYPNDLPKSYQEKYPKENFSDQMESMSYYNECLRDFFYNASKQSWYSNTVFIFCSDHWMYPDTRSMVNDVQQSFHIPIIIHDPSRPQKMRLTNTVSQMDIINTILCMAGSKENFISYGENLLDSPVNKNRVIFSRENSNLYQAFDSSYVLGFNPVTAKAEFCYNYKTDLKREHNLAPGVNNIVDSLVLKMKGFLQTASYHYLKKL